MSEEQNTTVNQEVPGWVKKAPELLPVWDWWVKEGKQTLLLLAVAGVCVGGWYAVKAHQAAKAAAADKALVNAFTTEELEEAVKNYGGTKDGRALKFRLAKSLYDAERYEEARATYQELTGSAKKDDPLAALAVYGTAYTYEGEKNYAKAKELFGTIAADKDGYLATAAQLGALRCQALGGDKDGALKALAEIKDPRAERLADVLKRFDPNRKAASLFDAADAAAKQVEKEKAAKAATVKAPEAPKPAPAVKAPEAPKPAPAAKAPEAPKAK